ncbi:effector-associated domain 2-containing protein [Streptomyces krungchingensis]
MEQHSPARVRNDLIVGIVDVLQGSATVQEAVSREIWSVMLADELGISVEPLGQEPVRSWLLHTVRACTNSGDGLACLARTLEYVEQQSKAVAALWPLVDEWDAVDFFAGADLRVLRPALSSERSWGLAAMARRASRSRVQELPTWCRTPWQVFLRLAGENSPADELPPSMAFLTLCAEQMMEDGRPAEAEVLRRFNRHHARELSVNDLLGDWRPDFTQPAPSLVPAYLVIQFEPDRVVADRYYVSHWRQSDSDGWHPVPGETALYSREELPGAVERLVEEAEDKWADLRQPVIVEFILPEKLLNEPVEWWSIKSDSALPVPLVMDYPVVVRSLERLQRTGWHRAWHTKWRHLQERPADVHPYWGRPGGDSHPFHLERELKEDAQAVCLVLSEPPSNPSGMGRRELLAGLRAGVPAMIWHRSDCSDPQFRNAVAEITQQGNLSGLAERVGTWRREALALGPEGWDQHVGRHMTVLFDDPDRKPSPLGAQEVLQLTRPPTQPEGLRRSRGTAAGRDGRVSRDADADICHVRVTVVDGLPVTSAESRLLLRVAPGSAHPWSDSETARRPWLAVTATPLTSATVEPATALLRPCEREEDGAEFTFVARSPGRHVIRFTVSLERTGTVLQEVEAEFDVRDKDHPGAAAIHTVSQQGGSGR